MSRIFPVLIPAPEVRELRVGLGAAVVARARGLTRTIYVQAQTWYQAREKMQNINRSAVVGVEIADGTPPNVDYFFD